MELRPALCYRALLARDVRYDGRFFTCVRTTGIYCRPICPARPPKLENCLFVPTAAAAQEAGFRPCLRCRPESSPDLDAWRGTSATVSRALKLIEGGALDAGDVAALAGRLHIGERQLRRLFRRHIGAAPVTVAQTRRVLLARQLINQTSLSMTQVALASGFGSVRRFNETFQRLYQRPPGELRRRSVVTAPSSVPDITLLLPYRPPYDWASMLQFLGARSIEGLEVVEHGTYARVIELGGVLGVIVVSHAPKHSALRVNVRFPRLDALPVIITRVRRMFDLSADPTAIATALGADQGLAPLVSARPGLRVPGAWDGYEIAMRAVLGQQITLQGATRLAGRLVSAAGQRLGDDAGLPGLTHGFPRPGQVTAVALAGLGVPRGRAAALLGITSAARSDPHLFDPRHDLEEAVARLRDLPGIGEWTAQYIAMRALGESDAMLADDVALRGALARRGSRPGAREVLDRAERWRPWRAYAVLHLWMAGTKARKTSATRRKHVAAI